MTPDFAVVVVNFGSAELLRQNLAELTPGIRGDGIVVVVDNFSGSEERRRLKELSREQGWLAHLPEGNEGFGAGVNQGIELARRQGATAFLVLNPDARIPAEDVRELVRSVREDPLALISPVVRRPDGSPYFAGADLYLEDGRIRSAARRRQGVPVMPWLSGACFAVSEQLWERVGGFDPEYFLYWEDVDLSRRVLDAGGRLVVHPSAVATHDEGGTQTRTRAASSSKSPTYYYFTIRNRLLFAARHLDAETIRGWRRASVRIAYEILLQGGRRQFLRPARPIGAALRALRDGDAVARQALRGKRP